MSLTQFFFGLLLFAIVCLVGFMIYLASNSGKQKEAIKELNAKIKTEDENNKQNEDISKKLLDSNRTGISGWAKRLRGKNNSN